MRFNAVLWVRNYLFWSDLKKFCILIRLLNFPGAVPELNRKIDSSSIHAYDFRNLFRVLYNSHKKTFFSML
jgi:hypothetical protein